MFFFASYCGHLGWLAGSPDTFFKLDTPMMIVAKFSLIWNSSFRAKIFEKVNDDGRKVIRKGPGELKRGIFTTFTISLLFAHMQFPKYDNKVIFGDFLVVVYILGKVE